MALRNGEGKRHIKEQSLEGGLGEGGKNQHWVGGNATIELGMEESKRLELK